MQRELAPSRCDEASDLLARSCPGTPGCRAWAAASAECGAPQPCERQLCHWLGDCTLGPCAGAPPPLGPAEHVCAYLATSQRNEPYLAYRSASGTCPLRLESAPLFEDAPVPLGSAAAVMEALGA